MKDAVTQLMTGQLQGGVTGVNALTAANLWGALAPAGALIGTLVVIAFGIYVFRKIVKRASRGKGGF